MLARFHLAILTSALASAWLGGCCCPPISCRYGEPGCPAGPLAPSCGCGAGCTDCGCGQGASACACGDGHAMHHGLGAHFPLLARGHLHHEPVPTEQKADYVSPTAKYHPVPTRPVFEPQPDYPPPYLLPGPEPRPRLHESHAIIR
ncbi:MAG TPA: hypothetical protein VFV87_15275 [Pirellulaceae bacterium]|nr:hypothetical protein [Pirellulaceae bacterium]